MEDVNSYTLFWDEMEHLDQNCWILEPLNPSRIDVFRRLSIENNVSINIRVDPRNPREIPVVQFLGCESCKFKFSFLV